MPATPRHTAPRLKDEASQRYPFVNKGKIDVSGGHHDAGDYSKYTINSTRLVHYLMFAVDSFPGVADLDNLGLPESGDGISDIMQEAKWEADFLAKMQDADGGFYFLVYPREREYESNVTPDQGDLAGGLAEEHVCNSSLGGGAGAVRFLAPVQEQVSAGSGALPAKGATGLEVPDQRDRPLWQGRLLPEDHALRQRVHARR